MIYEQSAHSIIHLIHSCIQSYSIELYRMQLYCIELYRISCNRIGLYRIKLHHIELFHIESYRISSHIVSDCIASRSLMLNHHIVLYGIITPLLAASTVSDQVETLFCFILQTQLH